MADCRLVEMQAVEYFLDLLDGDETNDLRTHIKACVACAGKVRDVRGGFQALARWNDVTPSRERVRGLLAKLRERPGPADDADSVDPGEAIAIDLPGEASGEAAAVAASEVESVSAPGLLLGPALSEDERHQILVEMGFDPTGRKAAPAPTPVTKTRTREVALDELTQRAEAAAARVSGRLSRSAADQEWAKLTGSTMLGGGAPGAPAVPGTPAVPGATDPVPQTPVPVPDAKRKSARWDAFAGTTQLGGDAPAPPPSSGLAEIPLDDDADEGKALMGTTILSAGAGGAPMPRYASKVLQKIKAEDPKVRALKRAAKKGAVRTPAWLVAFGLHAGALAATVLVVWAVAEPPHQAQISLGAPPEEPPPPEDLPPEKLIQELEELDPQLEPSEHSEEVSETEMQPTERVGIATDANAAKETIAPRIEPREERTGPGGRGGGGGGALASVERGLAWLAAHQSVGDEEDGAWESTRFVERCAHHGGPACAHGVTPGQGDKNFTPGLTGLGTLCFLASAYTHTDPRAGSSESYRKRHERYRRTVARALEYLLRRQDPDGAIGRKVRGREDPDHEDAEGYMYNHVIATLALCDALATTGDANLLTPAQRAIDFLAAAQDPRGGWDYYKAGALPKDGRDAKPDARYRVDLSITGWAVMAVKVAEMAGLKVPGQVKPRIRTFLERMERGDHPEPRYAEGYFEGWTPADMARALSEVRASGDRAREAELARTQRLGEPRRGVAMVAVAALSKMYLGAPASSPKLREQVNVLLANPPSVDALKRHVPGSLGHDHSYYYWYYGTLACWNLDDATWHNWWTDNLEKPILALQVPDGAPATGSWPPELDAGYGAYAGRLYATTLSLLTLEVFYRYAPLYQRKAAEIAEKPRAFEELVREVGARCGWIGTPATPPADDPGTALVAALDELADHHGTDERVAAALGLAARVVAPKPPPDPDKEILARFQQAARAAKRGAETAVRCLGRLPRGGGLQELAAMLRDGVPDPRHLVRVLIQIQTLRLYADQHVRGLVLGVAGESGDPEVRSIGAQVAVQIEKALKRKAELARAAAAARAAESAPAGGAPAAK